jgi:hypothetical protein
LVRNALAEAEAGLVGDVEAVVYNNVALLMVAEKEEIWEVVGRVVKRVRLQVYGCVRPIWIVIGASEVAQLDNGLLDGWDKPANIYWASLQSN